MMINKQFLSEILLSPLGLTKMKIEAQGSGNYEVCLFNITVDFEEMSEKVHAYYKPEYEAEVALLFNGLLQKYPQILEYQILDYSTHKGIDFLVRKNVDIPIDNDNTVGYVELKFNLEKGRFNHSFENLREVICFNTNGLKQGDIVIDLNEKMLEVKKNSKG